MKTIKACGTLIFVFIAFLGCNDDPSTQSKLKVEAEKSNKVVSNSTNKTIEEKPSIKYGANNSQQEDWYWKNTQKTTNHKFNNWEHGQVEIVMVYRYKNNETSAEKIKVGYIDDDGTITINLPKTIQTETKLGNLKNLVFYDIQDIGKFIYTNPEAGYFAKTSLNAERNGQIIGILTLGNSVRVTYNLTNLSTLTMGDEGYIISWAYLDKAARIQSTEKTNNKVRRDGTNTLETENTVVYNLEYKPGWNFVKTEVIGKYDLEHERGLNASWFKEHEHTVIDRLPNDAEYFFRTIAN